MMAATQPFISGAISKTVNMPQSATVEDIADAYTRGWEGGLKALAIYRDGSKTAQALRTDAQDEKEAEDEIEIAPPERKRMPKRRQSVTHKFSIGGHEGYITAGKYEDGSVGEIFLTDIGKEGSTMRGLINAFATAISLGLQYGVPLEEFVNKFSYMRFDPEGMTRQPGDPVRQVDARLHHALGRTRFIDDPETLEEQGIMTQEVRNKKEAETAADQPRQRTDTADGQRRQRRQRRPRRAPKPVAAAEALTEDPPVSPARCQGRELGPACEQCGGMMQRTGSCYTCCSLRQQHRLRLRS